MSDKCCGINETDGLIICPMCKNKITALKSLRCPRCFTLLLQTGCEGECGKCGVNH